MPSFQQRIHALESGAEINIVVPGLEPDPEMAANLLAEIEAQREKVTEAEQEAARYSGGLVQAMALSALATARNTLAMLEQRYLSAEYGLAMPIPVASPETTRTAASPAVENNPASDCLNIEDFDSSVLDRNDTFVDPHPATSRRPPWGPGPRIAPSSRCRAPSGAPWAPGLAVMTLGVQMRASKR